MTAIDPRTPVIIGIGQVSERIGDPGYAARSPMDLAGAALAEAIEDAGGSADLPAAIDTIAAIRQFEISTPMARAPFGKADNPPRAIAKRVGAKPERAILEVVGGQGPQKLVGELASEIHSGRSKVAAIVGAEAISTMMALSSGDTAPNWSETSSGTLEDRGYGMKGALDATLIAHGVTGAIPAYALLENARRRSLGHSREEHRRSMAELFAPFTDIAAGNPHAASPERRTAQELAQPSQRNRIVADPYTKGLVARDKVNQGAALLLASIETARALGLPEERWVHIHAATDAKEASVMQRANLAEAPSALASARAALEIAQLSTERIDAFDIYSCFPIAVANLIEGLSIEPDDPRGLTLTGGLPYFGGAGNNYSAHAIAEAVMRCRAAPGSHALVVANGGFMSKYATGIYSTRPADWSRERVRTLDDQPGVVAVRDAYDGAARIESYTVQYGRGGPRGTVIARTQDDERIAAIPADERALSMLENEEPFGRTIAVRHDGKLNRFTTA